jgi:hypothetical protein
MKSKSQEPGAGSPKDKAGDPLLVFLSSDCWILTSDSCFYIYVY